MATQPSLRIGDRERDAVAAELQEHYAHGRLTLEEFNERIDAVFTARTQSDLSRLHLRPAARAFGRSAAAGLVVEPAAADGHRPGRQLERPGPEPGQPDAKQHRALQRADRGARQLADRG